MAVKSIRIVDLLIWGGRGVFKLAPAVLVVCGRGSTKMGQPGEAIFPTPQTVLFCCLRPISWFVWGRKLVELNNLAASLNAVPDSACSIALTGEQKATLKRCQVGTSIPRPSKGSLRRA